MLTFWEPRRDILVGELSWLDEHRLLFFPAHGRPGDELVVKFDRTQVVATGRVEFEENGRRLCSLSAISQSGVADPDDYSVAWQIWQQVAPLQRMVIAKIIERYSPESGETAKQGSP